MKVVGLAVCAALIACLGTAAWGEETLSAPVIAIVGVGQERQSPERQALQDGLVHLVQSELSNHSAARVVSRSQMALFLDELGLGAAQLTEPQTGQRFGSALSADYLVLVELAGERELRAVVTVTQVRSGEQVWGAGFTRPTEELASLADEVSGALIKAMDLPPLQAQVSTAGPAPMVAVLDFRSGGLASPLDQHLADLADLLSANLSALDVPLVERQKLVAVLAELGLSASGLVRSADMGKVGRLLGAQRMVDTVVIVSGQAVLLDSQVVEPETGLVVGSCLVLTDAQHLPAAVQELATKVADALRVPVTEAGRTALSQQATTSLEAAFHAAAGWRLGESGQAEEAVKELQQAVYLDPNAPWPWDQLGQQYFALDQMDHYGEAMRRFFAAAQDKADPDTLAMMALGLATAEIWQRHAAESEVAAKLSLHYRENQHGYYALLHALADQAKFEEGRRFCEALVGRKEVPHSQLISAWDVFIGWFAGAVGSDPTENHIRWELSNIARALDLFPEEDAEADFWLAANLSDGLLITVLGTSVEPLRLDIRGSHLEEGLALAHRMAERTRGRWLPGRGWFLVGALEYKLGRYEEAIAALEKCLQDYPDISYDTGHQAIPVGPANGIVHYTMGRVYQDQMKDREKAIASYQRALMILDPERDDAKDALARLQALGGAQLPAEPWVRRIGGLGQRLQTDGRWRAADWLRGQGYDLRLPSSAPMETHLASEGVQILIWEGRTSDYLSAEQLRAYVAGGGNLLVCLGSQPSMVVIGPTLATSSGTMNLNLSWLLPAFSMDIRGRAIELDSVQLSAGPVSWLRIAKSATYSGVWFPLQVSREAAVLRIGETWASDEIASVAAAGDQIGLGKVIVVSLRDWFVGGDGAFDLTPWQLDLLQGALDWFAEDDLPQHNPQAAKHWAVAREWVAVGEYGAAVQELDKVEEGVPSAADARYWAGCLLADKLGDTDGAVNRWRAVITSESVDPWLVRMAHLRLGIAAVRAGDERTATPELTLAAGEEPDGIWGQAWVAAGDLKLAQGDYLGAAQAFRKVADELGHTEERFRALFGLAYALDRQGKPEAAARVYDAIVVEFGEAPLPVDMDNRWPDPWTIYYPSDKRSDEPRVADAVAAARLH